MMEPIVSERKQREMAQGIVDTNRGRELVCRLLEKCTMPVYSSESVIDTQQTGKAPFGSRP